jgi:perosamine synthetase
VRQDLLPYGRQSIDDEDINAVVDVLSSNFLTTGPQVAEFEQAFAVATNSREAVAVSSGTAALHAAIHALDIGPGDEVIVPAITFAASANCVVFQGGTPVFADVDPDMLLIDPVQVERLITPATRAIIAVDYAGHPCDYDALRALADQYTLALLDDACHAIGGSYRGRAVGTLADLNTFSMHPVKHITTGEGGVITTNNSELAQKMRVFRNHGITTNHQQRAARGSWFYEMVTLGYNYRLSDIHCALGVSQLRKLHSWVARRQAIAQQYDSAFQDMPAVRPLAVQPDVEHAYHLYVIRLDLERLREPREVVFRALRAEGIGVNVHYIPVHLQPYYRQHWDTQPGQCPVAEAAYETIVSLPLFPQMTDEDVADVLTAVHKVTSAVLV